MDFAISNMNYHRPVPHVADPDDAAGFEPDPGAIPDPQYRGGKILTDPSFVSLYYGSYWNTAKGKADSSYEDAFAKYLVRSKYTTIWKQYGVNKGKFLGSKSISAPKRALTVNDAKIRQIVSQQLASKTVPPADGKTVYTVFLPPDTVLLAPGDASSLYGLGGYHGSFDLPNGKRVYYAAVVYAKGTNGIDFNGNPRDNMSIIASHEWTEAATDPDVNNGKLGWYDAELGEIADIPINQGLYLDEVYGRLGRYAVQKIWSNVDDRNEIVANGLLR